MAVTFRIAGPTPCLDSVREQVLNFTSCNTQERGAATHIAAQKNWILWYVHKRASPKCVKVGELSLAPAISGTYQGNAEKLAPMCACGKADPEDLSPGEQAQENSLELSQLLQAGVVAPPLTWAKLES